MREAFALERATRFGHVKKLAKTVFCYPATRRMEGLRLLFIASRCHSSVSASDWVLSFERGILAQVANIETTNVSISKVCVFHVRALKTGTRQDCISENGSLQTGPFEACSVYDCVCKVRSIKVAVYKSQGGVSVSSFSQRTEYITLG